LLQCIFRRTTVLLGFLVALCIPEDLAGQVSRELIEVRQETNWASPRNLHEFQLMDDRGTEVYPAVHPFYRVPLMRETRKRPWWLLPLAGAVGGALVGQYLNPADFGEGPCEPPHCETRYPPALVGAAAGALAGGFVELVLQISGR
jgi:hypothetical protein